jgi:hypothetical protein
MPLDIPKNRQATPKSRVAEVIERTQEDALRKLRQSGLPEQQALMVMQRISAFCLRTLRELDEIYRQFDGIIAEDGRSEHHSRRLHDKATALLLQVESGIADIVASAIRQESMTCSTLRPHPRTCSPCLPRLLVRRGWHSS